MENLTGIIKCNDSNVLFFNDESYYRFCFMNDNLLEGNRNKKSEIITQDGFIYGKTHENHNIAIHLGVNSYSVYGKSFLNTSTYIVSQGNVFPSLLHTYDAISFVGGTLNRLHKINRLQHDTPHNSIKYINDAYEFTCDINGELLKIDIESGICESFSEDGNTISNSNVTLTINFPSPQKISNIFGQYNSICRLIRFMTRRQNIGFDKIVLKEYTDEFKCNIESADVFMRNDNKLTDKSYYNNLTFDDLSDCMPIIFKKFWVNDESLPIFSFIPENDNDKYKISFRTIREVCSALENEIKYNTKIMINENNSVDQLIKSLKAEIQRFKENDTVLSNDTYNSILGSVSNLNTILRERLIALCEEYSDEILCMNKSQYPINNENIKAFVKCRNNITHSNNAILTPEIAEVTACLSGLVYCCFLERCGLNREKILNLCEYKFIE